MRIAFCFLLGGFFFGVTCPLAPISLGWIYLATPFLLVGVCDIIMKARIQ